MMRIKLRNCLALVCDLEYAVILPLKMEVLPSNIGNQMMLVTFAKFIEDVLLQLAGTNYRVEYRIAGVSTHCGAFIDIFTNDVVVRITIHGDGSHDVTALEQETARECFRENLGLIEDPHALKIAMEKIVEASQIS